MIILDLSKVMKKLQLEKTFEQCKQHEGVYIKMVSSKYKTLTSKIQQKSPPLDNVLKVIVFYNSVLMVYCLAIHILLQL